MIDFLASIVDFAISIVTFIRNTIASILWIITSIPQFLTTFTAIFAYCPTPLLVFLEVCLALTVVFALIKLMK